MIAEGVVNAVRRLKTFQRLPQHLHVAAAGRLVKDIAADQDDVGIRTVYQFAESWIQAVPVAGSGMRVCHKDDIQRFLSVHRSGRHIIFREIQAVRIDKPGCRKQVCERCGKRRAMLISRELHAQRPLRMPFQMEAVQKPDHCAARKEDCHDHDRHIVKGADDGTQPLKPGIRDIPVNQKGKLQAEHADHVICNNDQLLHPVLFPVLRKEVIHKQGDDHKGVEGHEKRKTVHFHLFTEPL